LGRLRLLPGEPALALTPLAQLDRGLFLGLRLLREALPHLDLVLRQIWEGKRAQVLLPMIMLVLAVGLGIAAAAAVAAVLAHLGLRRAALGA
jgi:hypothetical protein